MSQKGHITAMAGEFRVMETLFRLGHEPTLTLGRAKAVDVLVKTSSGNLYEISVKAIRGGGKWGVGKEDYSDKPQMLFVFLHYGSFSDLNAAPRVWVIPAQEVQKRKRPWHPGTFAIYCSNERDRDELREYEDAWEKYLK